MWTDGDSQYHKEYIWMHLLQEGNLLNNIGNKDLPSQHSLRSKATPTVTDGNAHRTQAVLCWQEGLHLIIIYTSNHNYIYYAPLLYRLGYKSRKEIIFTDLAFLTSTVEEGAEFALDLHVIVSEERGWGTCLHFRWVNKWRNMNLLLLLLLFHHCLLLACEFKVD